MSALEMSVSTLRGVGPARAKSFARLGLVTLRDLIGYFPRTYEDRSRIYAIADVPAGESAAIRATVASPVRTAHIRKGLDISKVAVTDGKSLCELVFFNQNYIRGSLKEGEEYLFFGKVEGNLLRRTMQNPIFQHAGVPPGAVGRISPVYPLTAGLSNPLMTRAVSEALAACADDLPEPLPQELRQAHALCHARFAFENIHFPDSFEALSTARRRLVFEELFTLSAGLSLLRRRREVVLRPALPAADMAPFYKALPFPLTNAQRRVIDEALSDMTKTRPMNRLVQGDVGSGKTTVAAACAYFMVQNGRQTALMAPTELLAEQHFRTLAPLFSRFGIDSVLLVGSMTQKQKREARLLIASGTAKLIIGTHALLSEGVEFPALDLVVADEQHRFGVAQRGALTAKGVSPHVLVMSATPIPRTLALIIYGDLDVSLVDELPPGRQKVDTFVVGGDKRERMYGFIRKLVSAGRQAYIVCPMIEENENADAALKNVTQYAETLREKVFPDLRTGFVHGRMKEREKEKTMAAFSRGEVDVLVSTTVIEVGMDVPNAAVMAVENAERFGLSQLHQLRGRVGRGTHKSYCILITDSKNEETRARLRALASSNDGFRIAEEDLKLRGPGDFFGKRQHGLPDLKLADLTCDLATMREAQDAAAALLAGDPDLSRKEHGALKASITALFQDDAAFN